MRKLEDGEMICSKCNGEGEVLPQNSHFGVEFCDKCHGDGIVDWVDNIMGKPIPVIEFDIEEINFQTTPDMTDHSYRVGNKLFETTKKGVK